MFSDEIIAAAKAHAAEAWPRESCGLVTPEGYSPQPNIAADPLHFFTAPPAAVLAQQKAGTLHAVVHSHPYPHLPVPSEHDMRQQLAMAVPWGIVPVGESGEAGDPFWWGGTERPPLIGRPYRHGVTDCYSLCRDYYAQRGIDLPEWPREWQWWEDDDHPDYYLRHFEALGFRKIPAGEATTGDGVLIAIGGEVSHAAVISAPGVLLHHPGGNSAYDPERRSREDPLNRWMSHVRQAIRYEGGGSG